MRIKDENIPTWLRSMAKDQISRRVDLSNRYVHVTQLLAPAHQLRLQERYWDALEVSADDLIPSLVGTAWHAACEGRMGSGYSERRIEIQHGEWTLIGTPDWFDQKRLIDFKTTKVWSRIFGKREWEEQLNIYRFLLFQSLGLVLDELEIHAVYLDWTENGVKRTEGHPPKRWEVIQVKPWPMDDIRAFIDARLEAIESTSEVCTPEERWERGEHWAVMKKNRKTALKRCDTEAEAQALAKETTGGYVEHRPGVPVRCMNWCSVRRFCPFGRELEEAA